MTVSIQRLVQGGCGLGRLDDGKIVFVQGGLPGEKVDVSILESYKDYIVARAKKVVGGISSDRVEPVCPLCFRCGGCDLMHLAHKAQIKAKEEIFLEALGRLGLPAAGESFVFGGTVASEPLGYRTRVRLQTDGKAVGFRQKGSGRLVPIPTCPVLHPKLDGLLAKPEALIRHRRGPEIPICLGGEPILGSRTGSVSILGKSIPLSNLVFFQSNLGLLPSLIEYVVANARGPRVMDLYSGVGAFSAFLEERFSVVAVERNPVCLALARSHLRRTEFHASRVEDFPFKNGADTIVVDPPRAGLSRKVLDRLRCSEAGRIVYVSCDSATFARDAQRLCLGGYVLKSSKLFDFYPQTSHMESVSVFDRRAAL